MIDWLTIKHFKKSEFSESPDEHANPQLILSLDKYRRYLDQPIHPSPAPGALARFDANAKTSRHYAFGRKSDAIDVFCDVPIFKVWSIAINSRLWGGIGVYFDTKYCNNPLCMLHLDLRSHQSLWFRNNGEYTSMKSKAFWSKLLELFAQQIKEET